MEIVNLGPKVDDILSQLNERDWQSCDDIQYLVKRLQLTEACLRVAHGNSKMSDNVEFVVAWSELHKFNEEADREALAG